jgi:putative FmdB family regulatory protein
MPIYEFACQDCGHEFEKIQSFSDSSTPACPNCQGVHVQRRLSAPAIHFKGSGWYITDSKKAAMGSATGSASSSGEDGKSESKSEGETKTEASGTKAEATKGEPGKGESAPAPAAAQAD